MVEGGRSVRVVKEKRCRVVEGKWSCEKKSGEIW